MIEAIKVTKQSIVAYETIDIVPFTRTGTFVNSVLDHKLIQYGHGVKSNRAYVLINGFIMCEANYRNRRAVKLYYSQAKRGLI